MFVDDLIDEQLHGIATLVLGIKALSSHAILALQVELTVLLLGVAMPHSTPNGHHLYLRLPTCSPLTPLDVLDSCPLGHYP